MILNWETSTTCFMCRGRWTFFRKYKFRFTICILMTASIIYILSNAKLNTWNRRIMWMIENGQNKKCFSGINRLWIFRMNNCKDNSLAPSVSSILTVTCMFNFRDLPICVAILEVPNTSWISNCSLCLHPHHTYGLFEIWPDPKLLLSYLRIIMFDNIKQPIVFFH